MLKNYFKIAWRNFHRHKGYSFVNTAGFAMGMACCLIIFIYVRHELSYDKFHKDVERIYRIAQDIRTQTANRVFAPISPMVAPTLKSDYPQVENAARAMTTSSRLVRQEETFFYEEIVNALSEALNMPEQEKAKRMKAMRHRILEYDINHWIQSFITSLEETKASQAKRECLKLSGGWKTNLFTDYSSGKNRLLFLDYDGTLITFSNRPEEAKPDIKLKRILLMIAKNPKNMLVIISGRDRQTMEQWLGDIPCSLIAEHGAWLRSDGKSEWKKQKTISSNWKDQIKPILKSYEARVPGSFVEIKEFGLVWHYRKSNPDLGKMRSCELFDNLNELLANTELQVIHGKKVIEVRPLEVNKGTAINKIINQKKWDFIIAIGDDWTDEDMFRVLPPSAYSIKIGYSTTKARFFLESPQECRDFLHKLTKK